MMIRCFHNKFVANIANIIFFTNFFLLFFLYVNIMDKEIIYSTIYLAMKDKMFIFAVE